MYHTIVCICTVHNKELTKTNSFMKKRIFEPRLSFIHIWNWTYCWQVDELNRIQIPCCAIPRTWKHKWNWIYDRQVDELKQNTKIHENMNGEGKTSSLRHSTASSIGSERTVAPVVNGLGAAVARGWPGAFASRNSWNKLTTMWR